ncbi:MAG TPA: NAD(P)/FAD-dependent oxidoreductase [Candidatus Dormibacteraeota bacterium]|nr:NAD(P)/FAD-dependent oxidoreductase [Candidatus Dormibacteraeota bacterium]
MEAVEAAVVGAGPAGLAAGAMLRRQGIDAVLLEKADEVGSSWRKHYDRLHLHTVRWLSGLPGFPIPRAFGKWVARDDVQRYLQAYAEHHRLDVRLRSEVQGLRRSDGGWAITTTAGALMARSVVIATGYNRQRFIPQWSGRETFTGEFLHSTGYRNASPYVGRSVLVIGTGNSGAEIAADLVERGAGKVWLSVRTPPNILRRDVAGLPTQAIGILMRPLPVGVVDRLTKIVQHLTVGDLSPYGLGSPPRGMYRRLREDDIIPILDVGLIRAVKQRRVAVVATVTGFDKGDVVLEGGQRIQPDVVIAATGFRRGLETLLGSLGVLRPDGRPAVHGPLTHRNAPELYFIGYSNPLSGNLRELGIDARRIAHEVARKRRRTGARGRRSGVAASARR